MYVILISLIFKVIECTVDLNLAELEYVANQLTPEECEKLYQYLHTPTYQISAKNHFLLSFGDRNCLKSLIHWNSSPNEGLGETHAVLVHRLTQIGRKDVADWLSNMVFDNLSKKLNKTVLGNPFKDLAKHATNVYEAYDETSVNNSDLTFYHGEPEWETYDTVAIVIALCILVALIALICELSGCCKKREKKKRRFKYLKNKRYNLLPHKEDSPTDEEFNNPETSF